MRYILILLISSLYLSACSQPTIYITANDPAIKYTGRIDFSHPGEAKFAYPGTSIKFKFEGKICNLHFSDYSVSEMANYYSILVDNEENVVGIQHDTIIKFKLSEGSHSIEIFKRTESLVGIGIFKGLDIEKGKKLLPLQPLSRKIEFIGNSITCGYGNEGNSPECHFAPETENGYLSYAAITARNLNADYLAVAYSGKGVIQNYDLKTETIPQVYDRTFPDLNKPLWDFKRYTPDLVVINLGTNDFAHAAPDSALFIKTYTEFLKKIRTNYPKAKILCIEGCMIRDNWPIGVQSLTMIKRHIEKSIAIFNKEHDNQIASFYLSTAKEGDFGCDYHPNVAKHKSMASELTAFVKEFMHW